MIMTRTPLRISLGGGGTDLPSYYRQHGGFVLSAAISKYVYITVNRSFLPGYFLKYSDPEHAQTREQIRHRFLREAIEMHDVPAPLEIVSIADVPAGTGLGSSGTFLVGVMHALHAYKREPVTPELLASEAVDVEMNRLDEPVGKQDHYIAAYGGLLCQEYHDDDRVTVEPLKVADHVLRELRDSLMLFFVGLTRSASTLLRDQKSALNPPIPPCSTPCTHQAAWPRDPKHPRIRKHRRLWQPHARALAAKSARAPLA